MEVMHGWISYPTSHRHEGYQHMISCRVWHIYGMRQVERWTHQDYLYTHCGLKVLVMVISEMELSRTTTI